MKQISPRLLVLLDQAIYSGSSFGLTMVLARYFTIEIFGLYGSVMLLAYLLTSIGGAVVMQPFQVTWTRVGAIAPYLSFIALGHGLFVVVSIMIGMVVLQVPALRHGGWQPQMMLLVGGFLLHDGLRKLLLAIDKVRSTLLLDLGNGVLQAMVVGAMLLGHWGLGDYAAWSGWAYLPAVVVVGSRLGLGRLGMRWRIYLRLHLQQGKWLLATALLQWWSSNLFVVASGLLLGKPALGALRLVQSFFGVLGILLQAFENYGLPKAAALYQQKPQAAAAYLRQLGGQGLVVFGLVLLALVLLAEPILYWTVGASFVPYAFVVRGMAAVYALIALSYPVRMAIRMMLLNRAFFIGYLCAFCFSVSSCYALLRNAGLWGCLIGLIVNQLIMLVVWQFVLHKKQFFLWKSSTSY